MRHDKEPPRLRTQRARRRYALFIRQERKCFYCGIEMVWHSGPKPPAQHAKRACTLEHLDDRLSPERGKHSGEERTVAACWSCNTLRGQFRSTMHELFGNRRE